MLTGESNAKLIETYQTPFLDEDGWFAISGGPLGHVFEWESATGADRDFSPPTWTGIVTGKSIVMTTTGNLLKNVRYEFIIDPDIEDMEGNQLGDELEVTMTSPSWPNYMSPRTIRSELWSIFDTINLDFVHELVWKHQVDAYRLAGAPANQQLDGGKKQGGKYLRDYVRSAAVLDILNDLMSQKMILAGQTKTLGDFSVSYHPSAGLQKPYRMQSLEKIFEKARKALAYGSSIARVFVKGWNSSLDRANFRTRLWKNQNTASNNVQSSSSIGWPAANSASERARKIPGNNDLWS